MPNTKDYSGKKVAVVYSLPSERILKTKYGETDQDSGIIARNVKKGLLSLGTDPELYPISEKNIADIAGIKADFIFNLIEWSGQDIDLSKKAFFYMRQLNIPVTGSSENLFVLTGDKILLKKFLKERGLSTPNGAYFKTGNENIPDDITYPVIVKPSTEHCSLGLGYDSIAHKPEELMPIVKRQIKEFNQPVLAEEFIAGREFMVYLIEEEGNARVLPIEEIIFKQDNPLVFQTYETKWDENHPDYQSTDVQVAKLSPEDKINIEELSIKAFSALGLWGYSRFDVRLRNGVPYILETNANPSVYDDDHDLEDLNSEVIFGIKFTDYLLKILASAEYHFQKGDSI